MTRIKEPPVGSNEIPEYQSPPSRILRSLRAGYDNQRARVAEKSQQLLDLRGKLRDTQESRDDWRQRARDAETKIDELEKKNERLEEELKKRTRSC